jgi:hypothetical protein
MVKAYQENSSEYTKHTRGSFHFHLEMVGTGLFLFFFCFFFGPFFYSCVLLWSFFRLLRCFLRITKDDLDGLTNEVAKPEPKLSMDEILKVTSVFNHFLKKQKQNPLIKDTMVCICASFLALSSSHVVSLHFILS